MASSQIPTKIQRGLKFTDKEAPATKVMKRERPKHKSHNFEKYF